MVSGGQKTPESVSISRMAANDLNEVLALSLSGGPFLSPWSEKMFTEEMKNPFAFCFVARIKNGSGERVAGVICFRIVGDESELLHLCVRPEDRGRAVGRQLMAFYSEFALKRRVKRFCLEVHSANEPAIALYRQFFYRSAGRRKSFYKDQMDAVVMRREV